MMQINDKIVWGTGELAGVFLGAAEMEGFVRVKLDIDVCSIVVLEESVAPVTTVDERAEFYASEVWEHEFCANDDHCGCMD